MYFILEVDLGYSILGVNGDGFSNICFFDSDTGLSGCAHTSTLDTTVYYFPTFEFESKRARLQLEADRTDIPTRITI